MRFKMFSLVVLICILAQLLMLPQPASAQKRTEQPESTVAAETFRTHRLATLASAQRYSYLIRHRYSYGWTVDLLTSSFAEDADGIRTADSDVLTTSGTVALIPVQQLRNGGHVIQATLTDPHVWVSERGTQVDTMSREFAAELAKPVYFAQSATGAIDYIIYAAGESNDSQNLKRGIIASLQVQLDPAAANDVVELDPTGQVNTSYTRAAVDDGVVITAQRDETDFMRLTDPTVPAGALDLDQQHVAIFDPGLGAVRAISTTDRMASVDPDQAPYAGEGVGFWSAAEGQGQMQLDTVSSAPVTDVLPSFSADADQATIVASINRTATEPYQTGSLLAAYEARRPSVDPELTVKSALAQIAADGESYGPVDQLSRLLNSDRAHIAELRRYLESGSVDLALYPSVAAALAAVTSPEAEDILVALMVQNLRLPEHIRNDALLSLLQVANPQPATIAALQTLSQSERDPLATQALVVLGGLLDTLAPTDPATAADGVRWLEKSLANASDEASIELYLNAIGNAGDDQSLPVLANGLSHQSASVRLAALHGLRKLSPQLTMNLIEQAQSDADPEVASAAAAMLLAIAPSPAKSQGGPSLYWPWSRKIGGKNIYAVLHAKLEASKPSGNLMLNAEAGLDINLWKIKKTDIVKAQAVTKLIKNDSRRFGFYIFVMGNKVVSKDYDITCETETGGNLYNKKMSFFSASYGVWIYGIWIGFEVSVGGSVTIDYTLTYANCGEDATIKTQIKPGTYLWANGGIAVSIGIAKAGASVQIEFIRTWLPATLTGYLHPSKGLTVNLNLSLEFKPISVRFYLWYKFYRIFKGYWTYDEWTVSEWSYKSYNESLIDHTWGFN
jgi:hypothetical protein